MSHPADAPNAIVPAQPQRNFMCPELYRAAFFGDENKLQILLGIAAQDPREETHARQCCIFMSRGTGTADDHGGIKAHGDNRCRLDEVTTGSLNTVLHIAAAQGHVKLLNQLAAATALAELLPCENLKSETALHCAARVGSGSMVSFLLSILEARGQTEQVLEMRNSGGDTAMHVAARHGHEAVVEVLIAAAPALSYGVNDAGMSPLYLAVICRSVGTVKALTEDPHATACGPGQQNALHAAVLQSTVITRVLLNWKPNLASEADESESTPLHYAASDGDIGIIREFILSVPSSLYLQDEQGFTPLHIAARMGHVDVIIEILKACPDTAEIIDKKGRNFLHVAIERGHESVVRYIVRSKPLRRLLNEQDNDGNTPLHSAVIAGNQKLANNDGNTPLQPAVTVIAGNLNLAIMENSANNDGNTPLQPAAVIAGSLNLAMENSANNDGNTPLQPAVTVNAGNLNLAILESEFIDMNIANNEGKTPFDLALEISSFLFMIGFVLKLSAGGARFGAQRQDGITPWESPVLKQWQDKTSKNLGVVAVLISTIALTAMFNVPGGYDSTGVANLRATAPYNAFLILDTVAVASSVIATMLLMYGRGVARSTSTVQWLCLALIFLWVALMALILAFMAAVVSGVDNMTTKGIIWSIFALPFAFLVALSVVWALPAPTFSSVGLLLRTLTGVDRVRMGRHVRRRFPMVNFYLTVLYLFWFLNVLAFGITVYVILNTIAY